jgi:hypothetical protein
MPIELGLPDALSCNTCKSMEAVITVKFITDIPGVPGSSSVNVRLCKKCFGELKLIMGGARG